MPKTSFNRFIGADVRANQPNQGTLRQESNPSLDGTTQVGSSSQSDTAIDSRELDGAVGDSETNGGGSQTTHASGLRKVGDCRVECYGTDTAIHVCAGVLGAKPRVVKKVDEAIGKKLSDPAVARIVSANSPPTI